jgi:hypothetical protein
VIEHLLARIRQIHKQLSNLLRQGQGDTQAARDFQGAVEILDLILDQATGGEVPLDHPLPVKFEDPTLTETAPLNRCRGN